MSHSLTLTSLSIVAPIGKNGKVSLNNSKAETLLNTCSKETILSAALTSRGAVGQLAKNALKANVQSLDSMLSSARVDDDQWGNLLTLLAGEFGVSCFSRALHSGKKGCSAYLQAVTLDAEARFARAESAKQQKAPMLTIEQVSIALAQVQRLQQVSEAEKQARIEAEESATA